MLKEINKNRFTDINVKLSEVFNEMESIDVEKRIKEINDERNISIEKICKEFKFINVTVKIAIVLYILDVILLYTM